ncbi:MAG: Ig-like domain-containing protein [Pseudomonadota bacterium]
MKLHIQKYFFVLFLLLSMQALAMPSVKVTLKVIDENGVPIESAKAVVNFAVGTDGNTESEITDSDGLAILSGSSTRFIEYGAVKDGYYISWFEKSYQEVTGFTGFRRWQPWDETLIVKLKEIIKPRPLYIGDHRPGSPYNIIKMPGINKEYSYDLIAGDWVVPYGQGTHRDFVFKIDNNKKGLITGRNEYDYSFSLTFSNEGDGIQTYDALPVYGSHLRLPHEAPESEYQSELKQRESSIATKYIHNDFPESRNYFFRIRTVMDDKGNIKSALYGKIHGNIRFSPDYITMLYYLNPDENDLNLESDYKKNIFPRKRGYGYTEYPP